MATDSPLRIGYAGSLKAHRPGSEHVPGWRKIVDWVWTYRNRNLQHHTRSGHYLLKGLARLKEMEPAMAARIEVNWWGLIEKENERQAQEMGIEELVKIEGYFSKAESTAKLAACDVLFLPLETADDPLFIPGKVFDYLQRGKPVLVLGPESDCTRVLDRAGLGIRVNPEDSDAVAHQLKGLLEQKDQLPDLYQIDREYVESHFHFRNIARRMDQVFQEVLED